MEAASRECWVEVWGLAGTVAAFLLITGVTPFSHHWSSLASMCSCILHGGCLCAMPQPSRGNPAHLLHSLGSEVELISAHGPAERPHVRFDTAIPDQEVRDCGPAQVISCTVKQY